MFVTEIVFTDNNFSAYSTIASQKDLKNFDIKDFKINLQMNPGLSRKNYVFHLACVGLKIFSKVNIFVEGLPSYTMSSDLNKMGPRKTTTIYTEVLDHNEWWLCFSTCHEQSLTKQWI